MEEKVHQTPASQPFKAEDNQTYKFGLDLGKVETLQNGTSTADPNEETHRGFKPRHSQMIALGGAIGTSLFLGTAQVLRVGGPLFLVLSYGILSILIYCIVTGIAEVATYLPVPGGTMAYYGHKYVSHSMGFAMGYLYWYSLGILIPYELVASTLLIDYWNPAISPAVWISVIYVVIVLLNFLPVRYYGEAEFWSAGMKIILILMLIFLSIVLFFGGGPNNDKLYFRYWKNPGPANTYIKDGDSGRLIALLQSFVSASFAFVLAPEQLIVTAGEMQSPRYNLPRAARRYIWRLVILFMPSVFGISIVCASNDPRLTAGGTASSPFVIAIRNSGIPVLDSIVNALILLSAITAGNAFLYSASRNLYSLAKAGNAPAIFKRCNRYGLPYFSVAITSCLGVLAYLSLSNTSLTVFNWLINITNTSGYISWICCGIIYVRYRKTMDYHQLESPYRSRVQPWGIYFGTIGSMFLMLINGFTVFLPSQWSVGTFLTAYIGIPAFLLIYFGHRIYHRKDEWFRRPRDIDMLEGMDEVLAAERPPPNRGPIARKLWALIE
ncbi:amino acid permease/ SLC12A domain-containing protein [Ilyonectria robusta]|uniref:amino acid permease/ SLC12A domain-containing protein n=1 Tax=Ilyonectria robusta TaxID=1079257 RepID=UPI001E8E31D4|nr:amino acid permease/ SLC12A domain-containing protein [Ilyonectria robusta]KAH8736310.1 amino acid permease/ SLC12A domain-containing protein [Ilyonectria robusta]